MPTGVSNEGAPKGFAWANWLIPIAVTGMLALAWFGYQMDRVAHRPNVPTIESEAVVKVVEVSQCDRCASLYTVTVEVPNEKYNLPLSTSNEEMFGDARRYMLQQTDVVVRYQSTFPGHNLLKIEPFKKQALK